MSPFRPGRRIRIRTSHGIVEWHGDEGPIEKLVPFNKAYVQLEKNGRQIVDLNDCAIARDRRRDHERAQER